MSSGWRPYSIERASLVPAPGNPTKSLLDHLASDGPVPGHYVIEAAHDAAARASVGPVAG